MSKIVDEVIAANKQYASNFGANKDLALPPARGIRDTDMHGCEDFIPPNMPGFLKVTRT